MPWTPEFNGIFLYLSHSFYKKCIQVNLPQLILDGDPRTRGSPSRINGGKFTKTIFFVLWIRQIQKNNIELRCPIEKNVIFGVNYSFNIQSAEQTKKSHLISWYKGYALDLRHPMAERKVDAPVEWPSWNSCPGCQFDSSQLVRVYLYSKMLSTSNHTD